MSRYTTDLRNIVLSLTQDMSPYATLRERIEKARTQIFNFDYPIWQESARQSLETKIIKHYISQEIGLETYDMWQFYLESKMLDIMPYYVDKWNSIYPYFSKLYVNKDYKSKTELKENVNKNDYYNEKNNGSTDSVQDSTRDTGSVSNTVANEKEAQDTKDYTVTHSNSDNKEDTVRDLGNTHTDTELYNSKEGETGGYTNTETKDIKTSGNETDKEDKTEERDLTEVKTNDLAHDIINDISDIDYGKVTTTEDDTTNTNTNSSNQLSIHSDLPQASLKVVDEGGEAAGNSMYPISDKRFTYDYATYSDQSQASGTATDRGRDDKTETLSGRDTTTRNAKETDTGTVTTTNTGKIEIGSEKNVEKSGSENQDNKLVNVNNKDISTNSDKNLSGNKQENENTNIIGNIVSDGTENETGELNSNIDKTSNTEGIEKVQGNIKNNSNYERDINSQRGIDQNTDSAEDYWVFGLDGKTYSELIEKYQAVIANIELEIIKELECLFMQIY